MSTNQPKKSNTFNYERDLSVELKNIFAGIYENILPQANKGTIEVHHFLLYCLDTANNVILYNILNSFLNSSVIEEIKNELMNLVYNQANSEFVMVGGPIRRSVQDSLSTELNNYLKHANKEKKKQGKKAITSDLLFLSFFELSSANSNLKQLFVDKGVQNSIFKTFQERFHEVLNDMEGPDSKSEKNGEDNASVGEEEGDYTIETLENTLKEKPGIGISMDYCVNMRKSSVCSKYMPLVGRENELSRIVQSLCKRDCRNILIVGDDGVGKTALLRGLALLINSDDVPKPISGLEMYQLRIEEIKAATQFRGMFEERMLGVVKRICEKDKRFLIIEDMHIFISNSNATAEYNFIEPLTDIFDGEKGGVIITTTHKGYKTLVSTYPSLLPNFTKITLSELKEPEIKKILIKNKKIYEKYHNISINEEILDIIIGLSKKYLTEQSIITGSLSLLDEIGAYKSINSATEKEIKGNEASILELEKQNILLSQESSDVTQENIEKIQQLKLKNANLREKKSSSIVTTDDVYTVVSNIVGIPIMKVTKDDRKILMEIETILKKNVIGQDEAIKNISQTLKRNRIGLNEGRRPIGSFFFIGNTGCGKTLIAKQLAKEIFGDEHKLIRFDMSEYTDKTSVNKLIGASAGYVGYSDGGLLTDAVRKNKHAVVLLDEIEKADDDIFNIFLQVLDEGVITDNMGNKIDFKNTIVIMTSNIGVKDANNTNAVGFKVNNELAKKKSLEKSLKNRFPPEFLNRIDEIVYFNNLGDKEIKEIIGLELGKLKERLNNIGHDMTYGDVTVGKIFDEILSERQYGARPILRALRRLIENPIIDKILESDEEKIVFNVDSFDFV